MVAERLMTSNGGETAVHTVAGPEGASIEIDDFSLWYGESQALFDVRMTIQKGLVTALIGPSGCGKSTLLRSLNRMNDLIEGLRVSGRVRLEGQDLYARGVDVIALRKRMGMVFQKPNPFPLSIFENVVYPLRVDGVRDREVLSETADTLQALGISLLGATAITTAAGAMLGLWASRRALRPLADVSEAAEAIAGGRLDTRL